jgi:hypothetical protein
MDTEKDKTKLNQRINALKKDIERSKLYLQELDSERQKTINDLLILTGRILELEEILKEQEPEPPV